MARFHMFVPMGSLLLALGCDQEVTCPAWSFPAVSANVTSASDGSPVLAALGEVQDGAYRDSLLGSGDGQYVAAYDRGGTYAVHIEREGFEPWDTAGIFVSETGGACSTVETEQVEVRLEPAQ